MTTAGEPACVGPVGRAPHLVPSVAKKRVDETLELAGQLLDLRPVENRSSQDEAVLLESAHEGIFRRHCGSGSSLQIRVARQSPLLRGRAGRLALCEQCTSTLEAAPGTLLSP